MKKSHVQLPKGHMKPFTFSENRIVYVLDLSRKKINECDINFLDTEKGFYDDTVETAMNDDYENRFFSLRQKLVNLFERKVDKVKINNEDRITIINYLNLSILRSDSTLKTVNEGSITAKILGEFSNNDLVKARLIGVLKASIFEDFGVLVLKNESNVNFVLPSNSYYYAKNVYTSKINADFLILIPLTPQIAYLLVPYNENIGFFKEYNSIYMVIENDKDINVLNSMALNTEIEFNKKFIISKTRVELDYLLAQLQ